MFNPLRDLDLNPVSTENLINPIPLYSALREHDPVHWSEALQAWVVTRYDDVMAGCRDPRLSAERTRYYANQVKGLGPEAAENFIRFASKQITNLDGPEHLRVRRPAQLAFLPHALEIWLPSIRRIAERLLERVLPARQVELVADFSYRLPPLVIAEVLGVPATHHERFRQWSVALGEISSPSAGQDMREVARRANEATAELGSFLAEAIAERRRAPGPDVLSRMIQAGDAGKMTPEELVSNAITLLVAGHLTTTDQINNGVYDLLSHPEQLKLLRENPALMKSAVEEMLRFNPAVSTVFRIAVEDFSWRGRNIRKGDVVFFLVGAANRDPDHFSHPDRFDITRDNTQQRSMSFSFGPHQCLGASLARSEMEIALDVLLQHLPELRLDPERAPRRKSHTLLFRGFEQLYLRW